MAKSLHSSIIAYLGEFLPAFESCTGGDERITHNDHYPAGALQPDKVRGTHMFSDMVLSRAFDPTESDPVIQWYRRYKQGLDFGRQVVKVFLNPQGIPEYEEIYFVKPSDLKTPDAKSGDPTVGMLEITCVVERRIA